MITTTYPIVVHRAVGASRTEFRGRYSVLGAMYIEADPFDLIDNERASARNNLLTYSEWPRSLRA
ncbi:hypothetical protein [Aurantimonas manganoxydans]|uniref:hypothetical protein n=1 Tax=Aurantimonas manganoxydans TaxID=651183 RepID=UPI00030E93C7|nr:hypothetical protein [Aurantimonas manganoxydans]